MYVHTSPPEHKLYSFSVLFFIFLAMERIMLT